MHLHRENAGKTHWDIRFILLTGWFTTWKKSQFHEPPIISLAGLLRYLFQVAISDFGPTIPYLGKVLASHLAKKTITYIFRNRFLVDNTVFLHSFRFESDQFLTFTWQTPEM